MPRTHAPYPPAFRRETIRLARASGKPLPHIAQQSEVSHETLRAWAKQADIDDGLTTEETEEVRQRRREAKCRREEREATQSVPCLEAAAFVAKETRQIPWRSGIGVPNRV